MMVKETSVEYAVHKFFVKLLFFFTRLNNTVLNLLSKIFEELRDLL